jgi:hypothetical protein
MNQGMWAATLWLFKEYPAAAMLFPLLIAQLLLYYGLGLLGLRYLSRELRFFFAAAFVYLLLVSGHPGMMARYKIPLLALVAIPAGAAIGGRSGTSGLFRFKLRPQAGGNSDTSPPPFQSARQGF